MKPRKEQKPKNAPLRLMLWTAIAGFFFGIIGFGEIAEDWLRVSRNRLHPHQASGEVVVVTIDDRSLREFGSWPWPRRLHGEMTDRLTAAGANRIFFDISFAFPSNPRDDRLFAEAMERSNRVTLAVRERAGPAQGANQDSLPIPLFARHSELASISVTYNYQNAAWKLPYRSTIEGRELPSFAAKLAGVEGRSGELFPPDYSIELASIPSYSAADILAGKVDPKLLAGRDLLIGATSDTIGDQYFIPGFGKTGGVYVHAIAAETLKAGRPVDLGWLGAFLLTLVAGGWALNRRSGAQRTAIFAGATVLLLGLPVLLEARRIFVDITPALFVILILSSVTAWRRHRLRSFVNSVSGLPNLVALRGNREGRGQALIVARVLNYAEILASLPPDSERQLVDQIVARLSVGASNRVLYQGDGGIFAWFEEPRAPFGNHIEALYALFRNPARIGKQSIDLSISFGVEIGSRRSLANRLASALVAAEEAAHDGLKWKYHDPETLQDASWKLSMLSQLDTAVEQGAVWVAFQPKLDLKTQQIVGAEALARWTHPEKGPIAASEFVAAAEQHDRIGKLTDFVLDQSIAAAAGINRRSPGFGMAVNLSARLLSDKGLILRLSAMLARHGFPAELLTLELTETAALAGTGSSLDMLVALRDLGVTISIDDYGTGLSTLDYLKKIPASEIKIDQSFVKGMLDNRSDRVMVQSTIALAHSLGRRVVAEGVESREVLESLAQMQCDVAQGFIIGRPMSLESITKRIRGSRRHAVA